MLNAWLLFLSIIRFGHFICELEIIEILGIGPLTARHMYKFDQTYLWKFKSANI